MSNETAKPKIKQQEMWLQYYWRPLAAMVYLAICIFDFIIAPAVVGFYDTPPSKLARELRGLEPQVAVVLAEQRPQWQPLTLMGSGLLHLSFGGILGVAAWTRGKEKIAKVNKTYEE